MNNPEKDGNEFAGWVINSENKGTEVIINGIDYKPTGDLSVVASWNLIEYPIKYNNVSEAIVTNPSKYTIDDAFMLNEPVRQDYDFLGWTGSNGEVPQLKVTIAKGTTGELIYNANWIKIEYDNVSASGAEHTKGVDGDATFVFKRNNRDEETYAHFLAAGKVVKVDGNQINEDQFEASSGSLILVLKKDYLNSLSVGEHELSVDFKDGDKVYNSTTHFIIKLKPADSPSFIVPTTGIKNDGSNLMRTLSMLAIVALGMTIKMKNRIGKDYWDEFK